MMTFKNFVSKLKKVNAPIISIDSENKTVKFIPTVQAVDREVNVFVKFDCLEGIKTYVSIPSGCNGSEKLAVKKEVILNYGL